jgi:hypothetical protein
MDVNDKFDFPLEWIEYITQNPVALETTSQPLISKLRYTSRYTTRLDFFGFQSRQFPFIMPNMLPNPTAFVIDHVLIEGISTALKDGKCQLLIGYKYYLECPAWMFSLREKGFNCKHKLFIPPLTTFKFSIEWSEPCDLGKGFDGEYIDERTITVVLYGTLARAIQ